MVTVQSSTLFRQRHHTVEMSERQSVLTMLSNAIMAGGRLEQVAKDNIDFRRRGGLTKIVIQKITYGAHFIIGIQLHCSRKMLIGKINASILFHCMKKKSLMGKIKETRRKGPTLVGTPKGTSRRKIVAVRCFVWCLGLQMWSGSEAVRQLDKISSIYDFFKKFNSQPSENVFLF